MISSPPGSISSARKYTSTPRPLTIILWFFLYRNYCIIAKPARIFHIEIIMHNTDNITSFPYKGETSATCYLQVLD